MFHCLPDSTWADGNLSEAAGQLGKMVEHRNQSQPIPCLSSLGTPYLLDEHASDEDDHSERRMKLGKSVAAALDHISAPLSLLC